MLTGQLIYQHLKPRNAFCSRWRKQVLYQLENADDVPFFGRTKFCDQQNDRCQQTLCRLVEKCILPHVRNITVRRDYRLGGNFCELFGLRLVFQLVFSLIHIHVLVHKIKHIIAAAAGWVAEIDNRNLVAVIFLGDSGSGTVEIALAVGGDKAHSRRAAVFDVRVQKIRSLADTRSADHQRVDIRVINKRCHAACRFVTADDQAVHSGELLSFSP